MALTHQSAVNGTATSAMNAGTKIANTASSNATTSAVAGRRSSFVSSLTVSAIGCSRPNGPVRIGPRRICMRATILRSYHVAYITPTVITSVNAISAERAAEQRVVDVDRRARRAASITYLSTSQSTMSIEPRIITASARNCPIVISRSAERLQNEGERIFSRYGLSPPFETR